MKTILLTGVLIALPALNGAHAASWQQEQWSVESFTHALGGGPETGPVMESGSSVDSMCGDEKGNLYLANGQFIDIVTPDGIRRHLAGTGQAGFRDGPAHQARFRMGYGAYYQGYNIACSPDGSVFVADSGNHRIRRVYFQDKHWQVDSWAGGGKAKLKPGSTAATDAILLTGTIGVAYTSSNEVIVAGHYGAYRIGADGKTITYIGRWPSSTARIAGKAPRLNIMMGDADRQGNAYFVSRTPHAVVKVSADNTISHIAGIEHSKLTRDIVKNTGDGPPLEAVFNTPNSLTADPDGSAVYVCGGDEYDIRRVPLDGVTDTATLMQNGRWYKASTHPNRARGATAVRPDATGRLKPDGELTDLMVSPLVGRDAHGNLYGKINRWRGMTQYVEGYGLLSTHIFRLNKPPGKGSP